MCVLYSVPVPSEAPPPEDGSGFLGPSVALGLMPSMPSVPLETVSWAVMSLVLVVEGDEVLSMAFK